MCSGWTFRTIKSVNDLKKVIEAERPNRSTGEAANLQIFLTQKDNARMTEKVTPEFEVKACVVFVTPPFFVRCDC